jgi:putative photosynthetic complex assembly protein 2
MSQAFAILFVLAVWWLATCVVLGMVWLRRSTFRVSLVLTSVLAVGGLYGLVWSGARATPAAAYVAFGCALAIWSWHELTFLLGVVTGPRKEACPPGAKGWERFSMATRAVIHHELALAVTVLLVVALTWQSPNQVGTRTFLVLWTMRLSAKFNLFLGVRSVSNELIPAHLLYLATYFRRARLNPLMPVSLVVASLVVARLVATAQGADDAFARVGATLVGTLLALAVVEHIFLAVPLRDAVLWRWATRVRRNQSARTLSLSTETAVAGGRR